MNSPRYNVQSNPVKIDAEVGAGGWGGRGVGGA